MDSYRDRRSRERSRDRHFPTRPPNGDSYIPSETRNSRGRSVSPSSYRRNRSHSPLPRQQGDTWRGSTRQRSPQSRRFEGKDDAYTCRAENYRRRDCDTGSARVDDKVNASKPSLPIKRTRDYSPYGSAKRERLDSPGRTYAGHRSPIRSHTADRSYRPRSRSRQHRSDQSEPQKADIRRRRSRSTQREDFRFSGTPNRSLHSATHSVSHMSSPRGYGRRNNEGHDGLPITSRPNDSHRSPKAERSPPKARILSPVHDLTHASISDQSITTDNSHQQRDAYAFRERAHPSGPSSSRLTPMTTTSAGSGLISPQISTPGGRNTGLVIVDPPAQSRGEASARTFNSPRGRGSRGDFHTARRGTPSWTSGPGGRPGLVRGPMPGRESDMLGPPSGPRNGVAHRESHLGHSFQSTFPRGSTSSASISHQRTQKFQPFSSTSASQQYLSSTPAIKEGMGEKLHALFDNTKAEKLEEEAARLRKTIDERELAKRVGLREWDRLERENESAALKSDLAEKHLKSLSGEGDGVGAF